MSEIEIKTFETPQDHAEAFASIINNNGLEDSDFQVTLGSPEIKHASNYGNLELGSQRAASIAKSTGSLAAGIYLDGEMVGATTIWTKTEDKSGVGRILSKAGRALGKKQARPTVAESASWVLRSSVESMGSQEKLDLSREVLGATALFATEEGYEAVQFSATSQTEGELSKSNLVSPEFLANEELLQELGWQKIDPEGNVIADGGKVDIAVEQTWRKLLG